MKKEIFAGVAAVVMFAFGGCAGVEGGAGETFGGADSVEASEVNGGESRDDEVMSLAESMAESMFESRVESWEESLTETAAVSSAVTSVRAVEVTEGETTVWTDERSKSVSHRFYRRSEEESRTLSIDSDIFPYDCEEIEICVDTEYPYYNDVYPYDCIDLANLKNYPNLKRLNISDGNAQGSPFIKLINCDSTAGLEKLEEIRLSMVVWDDEWLSGVDSLRTLTIASCYGYDGAGLEKLTQVERLDIFRCGVTNLRFVNDMDSLTELTVEQSKLNNSSFDDVEENYSLKRLTLSETGDWENKLTDITGAAKFNGLEYLYVAEKHLSDSKQQRELIQASLPECEITFFNYGG